MSREAREEFEQAQRYQQTQNQARKIRTEVGRAQDNRTYAAKRWPFELLQNAHDTGPRRGRGQIEFSLRLDRENLVVEHDGDFFTNQDLAALLSGGSNKEYDGEETTGRFGTGFLMTHAISTAPTVKGILERDQGDYERFEIKLERSGDENAIRENIKGSRDAIEKAEPIDWHDIDALETAEFIYPLNDESHEVARQGIKRFKDALPYLFATCGDLGSVHLKVRGEEEVWMADGSQFYQSAPGTEAQYRQIEVRGSSTEGRRLLQAVSVNEERKRDVSAITVLERTDEESWIVQELSSDLPRVFVQFPIADTETISLGCILNGGFDPAKERDAVRFEASKENLETALTAIPPLLELGISQEWRGLHRLARLDQPEAGIGKGEKEEEIEWWGNQLQGVAEQLSDLSIVQADGLATPREVAFLYPSYNKDSDTAFEFEAMYRLARRVRSLRMVQQETALEWASVARGWEHLGVSLQRFGLKELADHIRKEADHINELPVDGGARKWLADLLLLLFKVEEQKNYSVVLKGIIPNQNGNLGSFAFLSIDGGIPEALKDIAASLGKDVRSQLLDLRLQKAIRGATAEVFSTIQNEAGKTVTTDRVIDQCLNILDSRLKEGTRVESLNGDEGKSVEASARLIGLLGSEDDGSQRIQRCPLLKKNSKVSRVSPEHLLMAPEKMWPDSAARFAEIYPGSLVLHGWYSDSAVGQEAAGVLSERGLVHETPLIHEPRSEIKGDLLRQISKNAEIDSKDRLRNEEFTQIAKLYQVLGRCKRDRDLARAVMGFVLNHAVVEDSSWRETKTAEVYRDKEARNVEVQQALWPAELLDQAWIPLHQDGEEMTTVSARDAPIMDFVKSEWVRENFEAHEFLNEVFGIGKLDVVLHSHGGEERERIENTLAEITLKGPETLQTLAGQDPSLLADVAEEVRAKKEREQKKEENRRFGMAVQDAVQAYLEDRGIEVAVDDHGYDFDLRLPGDPTLEDGTHHLECDGRIKLEVKATRQSSVKLTPEQVRTARQEGKCFALCVVDLRDVGGQQIWDEWSADEIVPHARIIRSVGSELEGPSRTIEELSESTDTVSIGRSDELRYKVHAPYWENGQKIEAWVRGFLTGVFNRKK